jgi:RimJ/RimL family protein N-acetyltransferase
MQQLTTPRLLLSPWADDEAIELAAIIAEPNVARYLFDDVVMSLDWVRHTIVASIAAFARERPALYTIRHLQRGRVVGFAGYLPADLGPLDLVFAIGRGWTGGGLAREATASVLTVAGDRRVIANTDAANLASQKLLARLGFVRTGERAGPLGTLHDYALPAPGRT